MRFRSSSASPPRSRRRAAARSPSSSSDSWPSTTPEGSEGRIQTLLEVARMSPKDPEVRKELAASLKARFGAHPAFGAVVAKFPVESAPDPSEVAGRIARWLRFTPGGIYFMPGRGAGRLVEMKPALDVMRLEVQGTKLPLSLVSAERTLVELPETHFLRRKVEDPEDPRRPRRDRTRRGVAAAARELRRQVDRAGGPGPPRGPRSGGEVVRVLVGRPQAQAGPGLGQRQVGRRRLERERGRRRGQRAPGLREGGARPRRSSSRGSMRSAPRRWRP